MFENYKLAELDFETEILSKKIIKISYCIKKKNRYKVNEGQKIKYNHE